MIPMTRRTALQVGLLFLAMPYAMAKIAAPEWSRRLVDAARQQIGVTTLYDPAYTRILIPAAMSRRTGACARMS